MMRLIFIFSVTIVFSLSTACIDFKHNTTQCYSNRVNHIRFYGTKTTYTIARQSYRNDSFDYRLPNCKPIMLYLIKRHAIRYPDADDIVEMSQLLPNLQQRIVEASRKGLTELCDTDTEAIRNWKLTMEKFDDNRISDTGVEETKTIAKRFKTRFPSLLNSNKAIIEIGVTTKERTAQTANAFLQEIQRKDPHSDDDDDDDNRGSISPMVERPFLYFHDTCESLLANQGVEFGKPKPVKDFHDSGLMRSLLNRINQRLGLTEKSNQINAKLFKHMIRACHFDYAINGSSPWCSAFGDAELNVLEYMDDLEDYYEDAYGRKINGRQTCPLIGDLVKRVKLSIKSNKERRAYLHFTHAGVMKRLYSGFGLFNELNSGSSLSPDEAICSSDNRKWRSSLISPFSANFAAVLYKCKNKNEKKKNGKYSYKVLTLVQENPIVIKGCDSEFCSLEKFMESYNSMDLNCDLNEICHI